MGSNYLKKIRLRDLIMDQKNTISHNEQQDDERFGETINKLQRKVESINSQSLSHLQNVHSYLVNNFDLKNNLEKLEETYGLDEEDSDVEIQEPVREYNVFSEKLKVDFRNMKLVESLH